MPAVNKEEMIGKRRREEMGVCVIEARFAAQLQGISQSV